MSAHCPFCFETFWQCASWVPHGSWWWLTHSQAARAAPVVVDGRLPESVQWIEAKAAVPVLQQLRLIADQAGSERLVIIDGNTTYHPNLLQRQKE